MDTLFVYYSLEGNTEFVAETAAKAAEMDVQRLQTDKEPPKNGFGKYLWGGKSVVFKEKPQLYPQKFSAAGYKNIILGFPVWASSYPPAMASYFRDNDLSGKNIYAVLCSAGGDVAKPLAKLKEALKGCNIIDTLSLVDPAKDKTANEPLITEFIKKNFSDNNAENA